MVPKIIDFPLRHVSLWESEHDNMPRFFSFTTAAALVATLAASPAAGLSSRLRMSTTLAPPAAPSSSSLVTGKGAKKPLKVVVLGGTGYVGSRVVKRAVARGHSVVSVSRRGRPRGSPEDDVVEYLAGDVTDPSVVSDALKDADAVVHAVGLLFDVSTPGQGILNLIVSGSNSRPGEASTYDAMYVKNNFPIMDGRRRAFSDRCALLLVFDRDTRGNLTSQTKWNLFLH